MSDLGRLDALKTSVLEPRGVEAMMLG